MFKPIEIPCVNKVMIFILIFIEDTHLTLKCLQKSHPTKLQIIKLIQRYTREEQKQKVKYVTST